MRLEHKLVFHIPELAAADGKLFSVPADALIKALAEELQRAGVLSFYTISAAGFYNGRSYPEKLITVFCRDDPAPLQDMFRRWFRAHNDELRQEALAFETDGVLYTENL